MTGEQNVYNLIRNNTTITALLDTYKTFPAVFKSVMVPQDYQGDTLTFINLYKSTPDNGGLAYRSYTVTINCRSRNESKSRALAETVRTELNRESGSFYVRMDIGGTLPPIDETDCFNTIVEAQYLGV